MREPDRQWKANNVLDTVLSVIEMCIPWIPVESTIEKDGWSSDSGRNLEQEHTGSDRSVAVDRRSQQVYRRDGAQDSLCSCAMRCNSTRYKTSIFYAVRSECALWIHTKTQFSKRWPSPNSRYLISFILLLFIIDS